MLFTQLWFNSVIVWCKTPWGGRRGKLRSGGGAPAGLQSTGKGAIACMWEAGLHVLDL